MSGDDLGMAGAKASADTMYTKDIYIYMVVNYIAWYAYIYGYKCIHMMIFRQGKYISNME